MKIVYMGTPDFAVPCLDALVKQGHDIVGVYTQPDKPKGRGKKMAMPPVKEKALTYGLRVYQPTSLKKREAIDEIKELAPDLIVVVAYGQILPKEILDLPKYGCINVHASLLPQYRGAAPINWVIINGEKETGITTMFMDVGLDTGDMLLKEKILIGEQETAGELHDRLSQLGAEVLEKTITLVMEGKIERTPQDHHQATYAPMLSKELGKIKWSQPAQTITNLIRGVNPWPTAFTSYKGQTIKIWKARVVEGKSTETPGKIVDITREAIFVATGDQLLAVEELQFSGGKRLTVREYLVGNILEKGIILGADHGN